MREQLENLVKTVLLSDDWRSTMYGSVLAANTGLRGEEARQLKRLPAEKTMEVDFFKVPCKESMLDASGAATLANRHLRGV